MQKNHIITLFIIICISGCATVHHGAYWGEDATMKPGWERIGGAAAKAAKSPYTWVPLVLTGILQIDNMYDSFSDSISHYRPLFGSADNASRWSDNLVAASNVAYWASVVVVPCGDNMSEYTINKLKGLTVGVMAKETNTALIGYLKQHTSADRPDTEDETSLPSGHTGKAALNVALIDMNVSNLDVSRRSKLILRGCSVLLVAGAGWARMEAKKHYISDVLTGISLANFVGIFFYHAFLYNDYKENSGVSMSPLHDGVFAQLTKKF